MLAMKRRDFLSTGIAATMMSVSAGSENTACPQPAVGPVVILIHGASHGGWCWRHVADRLRDKGYRVFTPTLTGLGDRYHLRSPDITLTTHIDDIANVIRWEELDDVVLVAHSYGGTVMTGVCDRLRDRIARAIFIDANAPGDGQPTIPGLTRELAEQFAGGPLAEGYLVPPPDPARIGIDPEDKENTEWVRRNLTGHPLQTLTELLSLENGGTDGMHRTFVLTTPLDKLQEFARAGTLKIQADPSWRFRELLVGHDAMVIAPEATADLLDQIIRAPA